ncbi:16S rRNA (cytosine967-C5)-methyltransferase [Thiothrix eikelboomii]|uniref:16S rRNA (cytosine(967)-C(5))-methyltransferase n=1 Tax=Thiothrix eikelboomii TaxID=92487 RepID=A0A1T4VTQ6_9GAMM|nr:16S rRNA (cytosine(967)-C(5))-methyltransferase RsmB [Thiothrix eikelboomii]SKA68343.1 16S rRNA (cytosine967-C5)-methyltransferase [Thiothrix eikelboomii]
MKTRAIAARALQRVTYQGESLTEVFRHATLQNLSVRDQAWVRHVCFGAVRWHGRLGAILRELLDKPIKASDKDIECLLRLGLYQIIYQRTPDHAAVSETVEASRALKKAWAGSLVNGVLRRFLREQATVLAKVDQIESAQYSFPTWLADQIKHAWPQDWQAIMQASNEHPPLSLRVNGLLATREQYLERLKQQQIQAEPIASTELGIHLPEALAVTELPDFAQGSVSVQDAAAQQAAVLLAPQATMRVLDACAAPGGKTCHLLERYPQIELVALDNSAKRIKQVYENLTRLNLAATVKVADAVDLAAWWDGQTFERILLDAPCSATGVIRRHPDIKLLRKKTDIATLQQQQAALLQALWQVLKQGGLLLYATCSILPEENNLQIEQFLKTQPDARVKAIKATWGRELSVGRQILPGEQGMDGFYYALLEKAA